MALGHKRKRESREGEDGGRGADKCGEDEVI